MVNDDRALLELLKDEMSFIEQGGYGRSVRTPWKESSTFQDSLTCLNFGYPYRAHPCSECPLIGYVPPADRARDIPCHHIPLDASGETIEDLESRDNQRKLEERVAKWLSTKIKELEGQPSANDKLPPTSESHYGCQS